MDENELSELAAKVEVLVDFQDKVVEHLKLCNEAKERSRRCGSDECKLFGAIKTCEHFYLMLEVEMDNLLDSVIREAELVRDDP